MNPEITKQQDDEYSDPTIVDYGTLQDLTAAGGKNFEDSPLGTPIGSVTASSTPI